MKLTRYFFVVAVSTALATGLTGCLSQDEFLEEHSYKFDDQTFINQNQIWNWLLTVVIARSSL